METMLIQIKNEKATKLLHELEELELIKVISNNNFAQIEVEKFKGIFSKEEGESFNNYAEQSRKEWERNI